MYSKGRLRKNSDTLDLPTDKDKAKAQEKEASDNTVKSAQDLQKQHFSSLPGRGFTLDDK